MTCFTRVAEAITCPRCWKAPATGIKASNEARAANTNNAISAPGWLSPPIPAAVSHNINVTVRPLARIIKACAMPPNEACCH
ncbi:hypothetical protein D3C71_1530930 [compost metagenome]